MSTVPSFARVDFDAKETVPSADRDAFAKALADAAPSRSRRPRAFP